MSAKAETSRLPVVWTPWPASPAMRMSKSIGASLVFPDRSLTLAVSLTSRARE